MGNNTIHIPLGDGCVFIYDLDTEKLKMVRDVAEGNEVPPHVREILRILQRRVNFSRE